MMTFKKILPQHMAGPVELLSVTRSAADRRPLGLTAGQGKVKPLYPQRIQRFLLCFIDKRMQARKRCTAAVHRETPGRPGERVRPRLKIKAGPFIKCGNG